MDYEQKYKKALERAKTVITLTSSDEAVGAAITIFPELKESEDERIRKELLEHCINRRDGKQICVDASDYRRWAAWLEKQGEKSDKIEPKPAWNEEDELMIKDVIHWINEYQKSNRCKDENDMQNSVTCENWLKTLKERVQPQPKQEWSEEDERNLEGIIAEIETNKNGAPDYDSATYDRFLTWLKSLKTNHWKPSEEQMDTLNWVANVLMSNGNIIEKEASMKLNSLYDDLKNL